MTYLSKRPTITELEEILRQNQNIPIEILPNGEVVVKNSKTYTFTYEELKPLADFLLHDAVLTSDKHFPGLAATVSRIIEIKREHEDDSKRQDSTGTDNPANVGFSETEPK